MTREQVEACVAYALSVLLGDEGPRLRRERKMHYGPAEDAPDGALCFVPSGFFGRDYGTAASLPEVPLSEVEGVPLLFGSPEVRREGGRLVVRADLVASAFFLLTRYEEMVRREARDAHGRFPAKESLPARAGFLGRPVVDGYAARVRRWLAAIGVRLPEPSGRVSVLLTHDVDVMRRYPGLARTTAGALLGRRPWRDVGGACKVRLGLRADPYLTFDALMDADRRFAQGVGDRARVECGYFFAAGKRGPNEAKYDVRSRSARALTERAKQSGGFVGLHASHAAGRRPELIAGEKARLEKVVGERVRRNRHHYLAWREIEDGWRLAEAGIDWDSSLGFSDAVGFRLGVCRPVPLFDPVWFRPMGIVEHPLTVMDSALLGPGPMGVGEEQAITKCVELLHRVRRHGGEFVLLWHNVMAGRSASEHVGLYARLLERLAAELRRVSSE